MPDVPHGVSPSPRPASPAQLHSLATRARRLILTSAFRAGGTHLGANLSAVDILVTLHTAVLRGSSDEPGRDRLVLSKAHAALALYSVLALQGRLDPEELAMCGATGSRLSTLVSTRVPGVDFTTGSLGQGIPMGVGVALGARVLGAGWRTYVLAGDGELQEGSNWEGAMLAAARGLDSLTVIVDRNRIQRGGSTEDVNALEPLADKWRAFGWEVLQVDGHDHADLLDVLLPPAAPTRPRAIIAETVKGKGVSFMEGRSEWHGKGLTAELLGRALEELGPDD